MKRFSFFCILCYTYPSSNNLNECNHPINHIVIDNTILQKRRKNIIIRYIIKFSRHGLHLSLGHCMWCHNRILLERNNWSKTLLWIYQIHSWDLCFLARPFQVFYWQCDLSCRHDQFWKRRRSQIPSTSDRSSKEFKKSFQLQCTLFQMELQHILVITIPETTHKMHTWS